MTELSPTAQAVLDAHQSTSVRPVATAQIAAALRAAADQTISSVPPPCEDFDEYAQGFRAAHVKYRAELLAIAKELEAS